MTSFSERFEAKGLQKGEAIALMRFMQSRFGDLPEPARRRIEAAAPDTLLEWIDRAATADSIDEVIH